MFTLLQTGVRSLQSLHWTSICWCLGHGVRWVWVRVTHVFTPLLCVRNTMGDITLALGCNKGSYDILDKLSKCTCIVCFIAQKTWNCICQFLSERIRLERGRNRAGGGGCKLIRGEKGSACKLWLSALPYSVSKWICLSFIFFSLISHYTVWPSVVFQSIFVLVSDFM